MGVFDPNVLQTLDAMQGFGKMRAKLTLATIFIITRTTQKIPKRKTPPPEGAAFLQIL
ncbi:hypothetical protein [Planktotalea arctica]|uniref:hypothetical protein n=1 Tax=Planktotalea arctica TaxID=1481893 RepID=UPI00321A6F99